MIVHVIALSLVVSGASWVASPKPAAAAETAAAETVLERPDEAAALATARLTGKRVKVSGLTTETTEIIANPDGSLTAEQALGEVRMRDAAGRWIPVDITLERKPDGSVAPKAHPNGLVLSGAQAAGGDHDLASVGVGADRVALGWSGALPEPVLDGVKATYPNVLPGVDLVVEATRSSFEQFVVVKSRQAAMLVSRLALPFKSGGFTAQQQAGGGLLLKNRKGQGAAVLPTALMWDASVDSASGEHRRRSVADMAVEDGGNRLTLRPDAAFLNDPATQYPVTIDPAVTPFEPNFDATVQTGYTNTDLSGQTELKLGTSDGGTDVARSYMSFHNMQYLTGKYVQSASLSIYMFHSWSCTAREWQAWRTDWVGSSLRWGNQPGPLGSTYAGKTSETKGYTSSCTDGWSSINVRDVFQNKADTPGSTTANLVLKSNSETDNLGWKKFYSSEHASYPPKVSLTYQSYATVGTRSTTPATSCVTGSGRPAINTATPTLKTVVSDPEGAQVDAEFEWWAVGGASKIGSLATAKATSGSTLSAAVPAGAFTNGGNYMWRVRGGDGIIWSAWSPWCEFMVDTSAPAAPSVTSTSHPTQTSWYPATTFAGTVSASDASGINGYAVTVDATATTVAGTTVTQTGTALSFTAQPEGVRYAHIAAQDKAGNWSPTTHYKFQIDATKPGAVTGLASSTHPVSTNWYSSRTITASWTAPWDLSGTAQFAIKVDQAATTIPATTDSLQTATSVTTTVATDGVWYLHVRAKDNAGNWSDAAAHFIFQVDTSIPPAPEVTSSTHPDQNAAYTSGSFSGSWTAPAGGASGYSVVADASPTTVPGTTVTTTGTAHEATIAEGTWYLHVRAKDNAGNWGTTAHFRVTIDTTAPVSPAVSSTDFPPSVWVDKVNQAGTVTFSPSASTDVVTFRYALDGGSSTDAAVTAGQPLNVSIIAATDGPHTLTVYSLDKAGNISGSTAYTFLVGTAAGSLTAPVTGDITAAKTILRATGHTSTTGVSYEWRRADTDTWTTIPASDVTFTAGGGAVTWPVSTTGNGAYPHLNWDVAKTINDAETGSDPLDGPLQVRVTFTGNGFGSSPEAKITFDKNRASAASAQVGPGSVNLITGNYTVSGSDVSVSGLAVARAYSTRQSGGTDAMYGPGWVSSVIVAEGSSPYTKLEVFDSLVQVGLPDGTVIGFTATGNGTTFEPPTGSEGVTITLDKGADAQSAEDDKYTVQDTPGNKVVFTRKLGDPSGQYHPESVIAAGSGDTTGVSWEKATVGGVDVVRPTRVLAPVPSGVSCASMVRGCKALTFSYSATTTATGSTWGDYSGRIKQISYTAYDPATSLMKTVVLAEYAFDDTGKLRAASDPRLDWTDEVTHQVRTVYSYDSDGIISTMTPPGQEPWQFSYTTVPADSGKGRLHQITRSALAAGTAITTVVYRVPVSGSGAPYDLSPGQTSRWAQTAAPTDATAIFPATQVPDGNQSSGNLPTTFERAAVSYLDANARPVNTVAPGGYIDATWYDQYGNVVSDLTAGNRKRALDASGSDDAVAEAVLAQAYSTRSVYSAQGQRLIYTLDPEHEVQLADGTLVRGQLYTGFTYDEGAPIGGSDGSGAPFNFVTTETMQVRWWDGGGTEHNADAHITKTEYDWTAKLPVKTVVDPGTGKLNLTTRTAYDSDGRVIRQTTPAGGASDTTPSTRETVYYSSAANSTYSECGQHPEWDGAACLAKPGGQPATGPELVTTLVTYAFYGQPWSTTESTSAGTLRTTAIVYDAAGRAEQSTISAPGLGEQLQTTKNIY